MHKKDFKRLNQKTKQKKDSKKLNLTQSERPSRRAAYGDW